MHGVYEKFWFGVLKDWLTSVNSQHTISRHSWCQLSTYYLQMTWDLENIHGSSHSHVICTQYRSISRHPCPPPWVCVTDVVGFFVVPGPVAPFVVHSRRRSRQIS